MSRKYIFLVIFAISLFNAGFVSAGAGYVVMCQGKDCNYSDTFGLGGGFLFDEITGYCIYCKDFVNIQWIAREGEPGNPLSLEVSKGPDPIAQIWDLSTGELIKFYKCPKCSQPFMPIKNIENIKYCPVCKQPSLKVAETGFHYD